MTLSATLCRLHALKYSKHQETKAPHRHIKWWELAGEREPVLHESMTGCTKSVNSWNVSFYLLRSLFYRWWVSKSCASHSIIDHCSLWIGSGIFNLIRPFIFTPVLSIISFWINVSSCAPVCFEHCVLFFDVCELNSSWTPFTLLRLVLEFFRGRLRKIGHVVMIF